MLKFSYLIFINLFLFTKAFAISYSTMSTEEFNKSGFIEKNNENFHNISIVNNKIFSNLSDEIILIYLPGSTRDDLSDEHCTIKSEFFSLIELIKYKPNNKNINLYLLCSHLLFGDKGFPDGIDQPSVYPGISKHERYRENIIKKLKEFIEMGLNPKNIFLIGHSCVAWHGLHLLDKSENFFNSTIAISPACFGPRSLWKHRRNLMKRREAEINFIKQIKNFDPLIFLGKEDLRENTDSLKRIININSVNFVQLPNKNNEGIFYVNDTICTWHNNEGIQKWFILDSHNLHFSRCFVDYTNDIINFINLKLK